MISPDNLSFGFIYDFRNPEPWRRPSTDLYAETLEFIAWTETVGFTGAWIPEHHKAADCYIPSPAAVLGAIAARTTKLRIGTGVALGPLHHPVRFAEETALLQILSNGRLEIQLAIGYRSQEAAMFGADFRKRGLFIHEMTHIWQTQQKGDWYLPLHRHPFCRYDYSLKPGWKLEQYGIEQQAEIVKHAYWLRNGIRIGGVGDASAYDLLVNFPGAA